jgi:transposase
MVSVPTVYNWHKLWRDHGIEGLANKARPGRKPKATEDYCSDELAGFAPAGTIRLAKNP